ncbi:MAG: NADH-quinone oxidoreductase subunit A [Acidimicrobiales bacterium]|nr:NADH-quinone oxidoreductase subunit A [Acidimicrobiales bacterium]
MLGQYLPILFLLVLAFLFAALSFMASRLLAPRSPNHRKAAPYECGIIPGRETPERFPVRFFLVAMIFIVFDIEIIFFYPWAIAHDGLGLFGLFALLIFSAAVFESFVYLIGNGALEWGPVRRTREAVSSHRTSSSTIRRAGVREVGLEGRDQIRSGEQAA